MPDEPRVSADWLSKMVLDGAPRRKLRRYWRKWDEILFHVLLILVLWSIYTWAVWR